MFKERPKKALVIYSLPFSAAVYMGLWRTARSRKYTLHHSIAALVAQPIDSLPVSTLCQSTAQYYYRGEILKQETLTLWARNNNRRIPLRRHQPAANP